MCAKEQECKGTSSCVERPWLPIVPGRSALVRESKGEKNARRQEECQRMDKWIAEQATIKKVAVRMPPAAYAPSEAGTEDGNLNDANESIIQDQTAYIRTLDKKLKDSNRKLSEAIESINAKSQKILERDNRITQLEGTHKKVTQDSSLDSSLVRKITALENELKKEQEARLSVEASLAKKQLESNSVTAS